MPAKNPSIRATVLLQDRRGAVWMGSNAGGLFRFNGQIIENVPTVPKRSDNRASLSSDGRYIAFAAEQENETSRIRLWDRQEKKLVDLPTIDDSPNAQLWPTLTGDGRQIAFAAWNRPGSSQRPACG